MKKVIQLTIVASMFVGSLLGGVAVADTDVSKFPLLKAVPEDVFIAVAGRANPERKFLDEYWNGVFEEFVNQDILTDIWDLLTEDVADEDLDKIDELHERFSALAEKVDWADLFGKEMIYTARMSESLESGSPYEGLLMGKMGSKKDAVKNVAAIKDILKELVTLIEEEAGEGQVVLMDSEVAGSKVVMFGPSVMPHFITIGNIDDVIFMSIFNRSLLQDSIALLKGDSKAPCLAASKRFKKAFSKLPPAEDSLVFFNVNSLIGKINGMLKTIVGPEPVAKPTENGDGDPAPVIDPMAELRLVTKVIDEISIFKYMAVVEWTDGYRVFTESYTSLKTGAKSKALYKIIADNKPLDDFAQFVPKGADNFGSCSGISFTNLYKEIISFVKKNVPDGEEMIAEFDRMQKEDLELDIEKDILSLFAGPFTSLSLNGGKDWVLMAKVTDEKVMASQLDKLLNWANSMLGEDNALMLSKVDVGSKAKFTQISHPMMMMMGGMQPPVIGCDQGWVMLGSSAKQVKLCLDTSRGDHPNILKNKRWKKEALAPKSSAKIDSISFTDQSNLANELQQLIGGLSMGLGMAGMFAQDAPPEVRSVLSSLPPILAKLVPVAGRLNFFQSSAAYSTFNGKAWHSYSVQNYKKSVPKPPAAPKAPDEPDTPANDKD